MTFPEFILDDTLTTEAVKSAAIIFRDQSNDLRMISTNPLLATIGVAGLSSGREKAITLACRAQSSIDGLAGLMNEDAGEMRGSTGQLLRIALLAPTMLSCLWYRKELVEVGMPYWPKSMDYIGKYKMTRLLSCLEKWEPSSAVAKKYAPLVRKYLA